MAFSAGFTVQAFSRHATVLSDIMGERTVTFAVLSMGINKINKTEVAYGGG
jgi:hypothetical protein